MKSIRLLSLILLCWTTVPLAASFAQFFSTKTDFSSLSPVEYSMRVREALEQERAALTDSYTNRLKEMHADALATRAMIERAAKREVPFLNEKYSLQNAIYQALEDIVATQQQIRRSLDDHIKALTSFIDDPNFTQTRLPQKASYTFPELQEFSRRVMEERGRRDEITRARVLLQEEQIRRKKTLKSCQDDLSDAEQRRVEFIQQTRPATMPTTYSRAQQGELLDLQVLRAELRKELAELRIREAELRSAYLETQLTIVNSRLTNTKSDYATIKRGLIVDTAAVKHAEEQLTELQQNSFERRDRLQDKIRVAVSRLETTRQHIDKARTEYNLAPADIAQMREWNDEPKTLRRWMALCSVGQLLMQEELVDAERQFFEAQIGLEATRLRSEQISLKILKSWYLMMQPRSMLDVHKRLDQEIKEYDPDRAELQSERAVLMEKRNAAINQLHQLNRLLDRIKEGLDVVRNQREDLFANDRREHAQCAHAIQGAGEMVRHRIDLVARLVEAYSNSLATVDEMLRRIDNISHELGAKTFWRRSSQSIEWSEFKYFAPEARQFVRDVRQATVRFFSRQTVSAFYHSIRDTVTDWSNLLLFVFRSLAIFIGFFVFRSYLPDLQIHLSRTSWPYGFMGILTSFLALILEFISLHYISIYFWLAGMILVRTDLISDPYISILFYLFSIPYLIILAIGFFSFFMYANERRGYLFISQDYQRRFSAIVPPLVYATIAIFFFREAFLLCNYHASHVPIILLGVNFLLVQIALIGLIKRDHVLDLIPDDTPLLEWVKEQVSRFYYPLMVTVVVLIVMSNPYVGYGRQVFYIFSRILATLILLPLFTWFHNRIKRMSSDLFFYYSDGESLRERFNAAKTWYGLFTVLSLLALFIMGVLAVALVWGHTITWRDVQQFFTQPFYEEVDRATNIKTEVSFRSISQLVAIVFGGWVFVNFLNRYVFKKVFDPLLLSQGVQNTVTVLIRYFVVITAILVGFAQAGLSSFLWKIAIIVGGIAWTVQAIVFDFVSYFIILIQRPVKIGDQVMLVDNPEVTGVVRQITPRSVIVRRRNSVTLIIPNSHILTKPIANWNYTRTFFAFNDILVTVPYTADPRAVKKIIFRVLDDNINVLKNPAPIVWLSDFLDNGFQFLVRGYLTADRVQDQWEIASEVRLEMVRTLREAGYDIASPTRTLKITGMPGGASSGTGDPSDDMSPIKPSTRL